MQTAYAYSGPGFVFLTPQIVLIPNPDKNALDVFRIPPVGATPCDLADHMIVSFRLPKLLARDFYHRVECFSANSRKAVRGNAPFDNVAHKAIVCLHIGDGDGLEKNLFILRESFMCLINETCKPQAIEWAHWGPQCSCIVQEDIDNGYGCAGIAAGQRIVILGNRSNRTQAASIHILDFNQYTVQAYQATDSTRAFIRIIEPHTVDTCSFTDPVRYVQTATKEKFDFDHVMINNQNIFGMKVRAVA